MQVKEEWKGMQYTDLTRKELQREYSRLTRKYTDFIRQPVELDLTTEDPLPGCANPVSYTHLTLPTIA